MLGDGNRHEHHHDQRYHLRHLSPGITVAHDRRADDAGRGGRNPLYHTRQKQKLEAGRKDAADRRDRIGGQSDHQDRLAPEPVRQQSNGQLPSGEACHVGDDDRLRTVGVVQQERSPDRGQPRQHDIDGQRVQPH